MAWTTKSPILENHWVPWGCRAHLGSVKMFDHLKGKIMKADQHGLRSLTKKYFFFVFFHQSKSYVTFLSKLNRWNLIKTSPVQIIMTHPLVLHNESFCEFLSNFEWIILNVKFLSIDLYLMVKFRLNLFQFLFLSTSIDKKGQI